MSSRRGAFGGGSLDPFGGSRGGLGRYNVTGDTIASLAEYDAYATAVAWANGQASDEDYLASLQKMVDLANPGTRDRVTAENKLSDAVYSIGRNKIAGEVNAANTPAERATALRKMLAYDEARLATMQPDNEAYRSQQDRVAGARVDIRQTQYSEMVNKVNLGKATTEQLLSLVRTLSSQAGADPDADTWTQTIGTLTDRVADEHLTDSYQAYQHNRLSGSKLLAEINARLNDLTPGSPAYKDLLRQREDLTQQIADRGRSTRAAEINGQRSSGTVTDSAYLKYLRDDYQTELATSGPDASSTVEAGNRLTDYTFSIAEDKLRYDVTKGKKPVGDLIAFYKAARARMDPHSERYRAITLTIDSLSRGGGSSGGGGGGAKAGKGLTYYSKQLATESTLHDILGSATAPPDFGDLFKLDISGLASRRWWENNLRSAVDAFQTGSATWTYYDKSGGAHTLAFDPNMMHQFDNMNYTYNRAGLAGATSVKDAQFWTGRLITVTKQIKTRGGQYTMDVYTKSWGDYERMKEAALAGGRWAEYANLTRQQFETAQFILGGMDGASSTNPLLTADQKARIDRDLASIAPRQPDAGLPGYNPNGDAVLQMMNDGRIQLDVDTDGNAIAGQLDPRAGFLTQLADGRVTVQQVDPKDPGVFNQNTGQQEPSYLSTTSSAVIRKDGQDIEVRQPIFDTANGAYLPVFVSKTGTPSQPAQPAGAALAGAFHAAPLPGTAAIPGTAASVDPYVLGGTHVTLPLRTFTTGAQPNLTRWVSLDGKTWVGYSEGAGDTPRIVIGSDYSFDGKAWTKDGKAVDPVDVLGSAHWWGIGESKATGQAWGIGSPGRTYMVRDAQADGRIDTRSDWMFHEKKASGATEYDGGDTTTRRKSYFTNDADVAAAAQAARASIIAQTQPSPTFAGSDWAAMSKPIAEHFQGSGPWTAGEIIPRAARPSPGGYVSATAGARFAGAMLNPAAKNLGLKPTPAPTLLPLATPALAPIRPGIDDKLTPIAKPKLPAYNGPTGATAVAQRDASLAAAKRKAAAAAAEKAAAAKAAASHQAVTGHAPGHGQLE